MISLGSIVSHKMVKFYGRKEYKELTYLMSIIKYTSFSTGPKHGAGDSLTQREGNGFQAQVRYYNKKHRYPNKIRKPWNGVKLACCSYDNIKRSKWMMYNIRLQNKHSKAMSMKSDQENTRDSKTILQMQQILKSICTALPSDQFLYLTYKLEVWPVNSEAKCAMLLFPIGQLNGDKKIDLICS